MTYSGDKSLSIRQNFPHSRTRALVKPPIFGRLRGGISESLGFDLFPDVFKRKFVERCFIHRHINAEVYDRKASGSPHYVSTTRPGFHNVRVRTTVWV